MRVQVYRTREITSVVYGRNAENEPVSRIKMADYSELVSMGRYSYLRNEAFIRKMPNLNTSDHDTEPVSMTSLSRSCATSRLEPWTDTHTHGTTTVTLAAHAR